jgi:hypothetical protein
MKTIDYFSVGSDDRQEVVVASNEEAAKWITQKLGKEKVVYLLALECPKTGCHTRIYVFDSVLEVTSILVDIAEFAIYAEIKYFLQEYSSYEEAYEVALMMREPNPLCYEQTSN